MTPDSARWRRTQEVCEAALERPLAERAAFLLEACGDDDALRRDVESLLEHEPKADGFLDTPIAALAADAVTYSPGGTPVLDVSDDLTGRRLGHYELGAKVGAGGMGVVYRAHDHSLDRSVAIKVLPASFASDPDRLARFEREARLLASLNHPNIAAIHGLERAGELSGLVLELIEGETLEARLRRGPMAVGPAIDVGVQIASALDHAHRRGIAHRDLKPANVMLTTHGVKLLDFGLAKWSQQTAGYSPGSGGAAPERPAGAPTLTAAGTILGTLHYMAPEQLEGKASDARADIFAFGAVMFEMLVGRKAFDGGSGAAIMAAVLNTEPPALEAAQPLAPRALNRVVRKCLAKAPDDRWQSARDLADELKWIAAESARPPTPSDDQDQSRVAPQPKRPWTWVRTGGIAAAAIALAGLGWSMWPRPAVAPSLITRFAVQPTTIANLNGFAVSPDGRELAYIGTRQLLQESQLFVRRLDQFTDVPVPGTEDARDAFYSPDGQWIGFSTASRLMKVNVRAGTAPVALCDCVDKGVVNGATWLDDGTIVFARPDRGLHRVPDGGGEASELIMQSPAAKEVDHHTPFPLPGGRALLFTAHAAAGTFDVEVVRLDTGERKVVVKAAYDARYLPSGHLVYVRRGAILAAPFDLDQLETTGPAVTLVDGVADSPSSGNGAYTVSAGGTLVYRAAPSLEGRALTWVTRDGLETPVPLTPRAFGTPRVSPDGTRLAFAVADSGHRDIWTYELGTQKLARLTIEGDNRAPTWSPDGQRLAFASTRGGPPAIWVQPADGSGPPEAIVSGEEVIVPFSWSPDGRTLVYVHEGAGNAGPRSAAIALSGEQQPRQIVADETRGISLSPDGRWIALTAALARFNEVQVTAFPTATTRHQISVGGGRLPLWRRDGRELVYRAGPRMFAVSVDSTAGFRASAPVLLFERSYVIGGRDVMGQDYDLAPDGRFLMIRPDPSELRTNSVNVVVNWLAELKQRVPASR